MVKQPPQKLHRFEVWAPVNWGGLSEQGHKPVSTSPFVQKFEILWKKKGVYSTITHSAGLVNPSHSVHLLYRDEALCNFMKISKFRIQKKLYKVVFDPWGMDEALALSWKLANSEYKGKNFKVVLDSMIHTLKLGSWHGTWQSCAAQFGTWGHVFVGSSDFEGWVSTKCDLKHLTST
jgi:hypothetical protein